MTEFSFLWSEWNYVFLSDRFILELVVYPGVGYWSKVDIYQQLAHTRPIILVLSSFVSLSQFFNSSCSKGESWVSLVLPFAQRWVIFLLPSGSVRLFNGSFRYSLVQSFVTLLTIFWQSQCFCFIMTQLRKGKINLQCSMRHIIVETWGQYVIRT